MSAVVQGVGYCFAAVAPTVVGYVHSVSGTWSVPLLLILGSVLAFVLERRCPCARCRSSGRPGPAVVLPL